MNIILLSGGSGKRLWPLSNDIRSKQFIKIFKRPEGECSSDDDEYESMLQRIYRQIKSVDTDANLVIGAPKSQISSIYNQLGADIKLSAEPCRKDTFPAIVLATSYLKDVLGIDADDSVVVCPIDPYVQQDYFEAVRKLWEISKSDSINLALIGIDPTYPSEKYGYILPESCDDLARVKVFKEKPNAEKAQEYINEGGLWNSGVFAYKLSYILNIAQDMFGFSNYDEIFEKYDSLPKISFDYAVAEHEKNIVVLKYGGQWKDLGTWNTFTEVMEEGYIGDVILDDACKNVRAVNELGIPILAMGLSDIIIGASPEGILVSGKERSSHIKPYVEKINHQIMFAEKSWGSYRVLEIEDNSMTVKVTLNPGHKMNYHSHKKRNEVWNVVRGSGTVVLDGVRRDVKAFDVVSIPIDCKHTVIAGGNGIQMIEVQFGSEIVREDKFKFELE